MKINEVFEKLIENPKDTYEVIRKDNYRKELSANDGYFIFKRYNTNGELINSDSLAGGFNNNIKVNDDWQLVRQSVDFMTAINSNQKVKPRNLYHELGFLAPARWLREISLTLEAINGKWEIE